LSYSFLADSPTTVVILSERGESKDLWLLVGKVHLRRETLYGFQSGNRPTAGERCPECGSCFATDKAGSGFRRHLMKLLKLDPQTGEPLRDDQGNLIKGQVRRKIIWRDAGISGKKATAAALTGGISMLPTGLSRKETVTKAHCDNCHSTWTF
jgi:hypothetical protein